MGGSGLGEVCPAAGEPLAIVGVGCRFPGAADGPARLWALLRQGLDVVEEVPEGRWDVDRFHHPDPAQPGRVYTRAGAFLQGIDAFDARFFGITPREASRMDPQQRLLLQVAWESLEDAGVVPSSLAGTPAGVFVGVSYSDYAHLQFGAPESINAYTDLGAALSLVANRVSHCLDLRGPSIALDTACSSSLVAVHLACQSLRAGESTLALAGGVNLILHPGFFVGLAKASMLSPTGRCHSFGERADGFVRAEGAGVVVLKTLTRAMADGDRVLALILATGVNSDGHTAGVALPRREAQEELLRAVYGRAGVEPGSVYYVEAHGTGTAAGDPVECEALGHVLGRGRGRREPLRIGSVKSNIGHAEPASGIAGLIKVALALEHGELPASLHASPPNPEIAFSDLGLRVQVAPEPLPRDGAPLVMGVNSFGFGGTNAHVVVGEWRGTEAGGTPAQDGRTAAGAGGEAALLLLSARDDESLRDAASATAELLRSPGAPPWHDVCFTAALRREHHEHRLAVAGGSPSAAAAALDAFAAGRRPAGLHAGRARPGRPVVFVFSGHGCQWPGMGRDLLEDEPAFRAAVASVDAFFRPLAGWSVADALRSGAFDVRRTDVAQPALFALQVGLVETLRAHGIAPQAAVGHSIGEAAAAYAAGALTLQQATRVVAARTRVQSFAAGEGGMAAAGMGAGEARAALLPYGGRIVVAAENSPASVTLAGDVAALDELGAEIEARGLFFRRIEADYPFHSPAMERLRAPLLRELDGLQPSAARTRLVSTVTGEDLRGGELDAAYWCDNLCRPVLFSAAATRLMAMDEPVFVEIGAHPVLAHYLWEMLGDEGGRWRVLPTLRRGEPGRTNLLASLGGCHAWGAPCALPALFPRGGRHARLPSYPWRQEHHWYPPAEDSARPRGHSEHPLLGARLPGPGGAWEGCLDPQALPYLADHRVGGDVVYPASAYVETALAAARGLWGDGPCQVEDLSIRRPLALGGAQPCTTHVAAAEDGRLTVAAAGAAGWTVHATARLARGGPMPEPSPPAAILQRCAGRIGHGEHYRLAAARGLEYGPDFRLVESVAVGDGEAIGLLRPPGGAAAGAADGVRRDGTSAYRLHPALLDAALQTALALCPPGEVPYVAAGVERLRFYAVAEPARYSHVRLIRRGPAGMEVACRLLTAEGRPLADLEGVRVQAVRRPQREDGGPDVYGCVWEPRALGAATPREIPAPPVLAAAVAPRVPELCRDLRRDDYYQRVRPALNGLAASYAGAALREIGGGGPLDADALVASGRVAAAHAGLLARLVEMLVEDGVLRGADGGWTDGEPSARQETTGAAWRRLVRQLPGHHAELMLLGRCGMHLAALLKGEMDPLGLLFPDGPAAAVEHLYESAPTQRIYGLLAQGVVAEMLRRWPDGRPLRVLELGGGTGGLTSYLLDLMPAERTDYLFTDVSEAFLGRAQARFARFPFVRYQRLDIEAGVDTPAAFDLVVAANVLHATADLRAALGNVRRRLAPGGLLLLVENHRERWTDLVFGLLPGWWRFRETGVRRGSALLDGAGWASLLASLAFEQPAVLTDEQAAKPQQSVILARRPAERVRPAAPDPRQPAEAATNAGDGSCLVLTDADAWAGAVGEAVVAHLARAGRRALTAAGGVGDGCRAGPAGAVPPQQGGTGPDARPEVAEAIRGLAAQGAAPHEVVWICGGPGGLDADPQPDLERACLQVAQLLGHLGRGGGPAACRLWLVTRGAQADGERPGDPVTAALWGLGRVVANERPDLGCRLVDVDPAWDAQTAALRLAAEICAPPRDGAPEGEVLLTAAGRRVGRLMRLTDAAERPATTSAGAAEAPRRLELERPGSLDGLRLGSATRRPPRRGEVEIAVRAAGLNFRDVMWTLGLLPPEAVEGGFAGACLGIECCGEVAAVGPGAGGLAVGDRVMALAPQAFSDFVIARAPAVLRLPPHMGFEAGATLPVAYATACYALENLARLRRGERVLVHGAAGGVGLAAVEVAQARGAEVFATAGSAEKRDYLRLLGASRVFDSRTLSFADEVLEATGGCGVDVVLNSLSGEGMIRSLRLLKPFGRFLEIGKRDIYDDRQVGLHALRRNVSYFAVDVDRLLRERPALSRRLLRRLEAAFAQGRLHPLPHRVFPLSRAAEAFRHMQQSRHTGKIVLATGEAARAPAARTDPPPLRLRADATFLVTGGLGGFGLATARWLVQQGARHLVLAGRRGMAAPEAAEGVAALEAAGARVTVAAVDVTDEAGLAGLLDRVRAEQPPLRGIFHAAMVLDDRSLDTLDGPSLHRVLAPKVRGAWNLHRLTLHDPVEQFVCFSSAAALVGHPGQAAYCAANAFLEALASWRQAHGLPGLAVAWGPIADTGYAARHPAVLERFAERTGFRPVTAARSLSALGRLLADGAPQAAVLDVDWRRLSLLPSARAPRYDRLRGDLGAAPTAAGAEGPEPPAPVRLRHIEPGVRSRALVVERLADHLAGIAGAARAEIRTDVPLTELGIDSLMSMELQEAIWRDFSVEVPAVRMLAGDTLERLAEYVVRDVAAAGERRAPEARVRGPESGGAESGGTDPPEAR